MAASATVGILRVLLSADTAEFQAGVAKAATAAQQFTKDIKGAATQTDAVAAAMAKAFSKAEEGTRGLSKAVASLVGFDTIEKANTYTKAVEAIGGVSKLTAAEQAKLNGMLTEATAKYAALGQTAPAALTALAAATKPVATETSKLSGFMTDLGSQVKASALGFISAQAVIGAVGGAFRGLTQFVGESVQAYAEAEKTVKTLTTALEAQGQATPDVIAGYQEMAAQFARTTVNSAGLITEMQGLLVQVGDVLPKDMEKALTAATNLSAGLGIDLRAATMLVGKTFEGETGTLKKYGITIDEAKFKTEGASVVLEAINQKFGGQAQAQVETYTGKIQQMANAWGDVQEAVGKSIVTDPLIVAALKHIADQVKATADEAGEGTTTWTAYWAEMSGGKFAREGVEKLSSVLKLLQDADAAAAAAAARAGARAPTDLFKGGFGALNPDTLKFLADYAKGMEAAAEADKKAAAAAEAHARAIASLRKDLFGASAIEAARNYSEAIGRIQNLTKLSIAQQDEVNAVVTKAIEAYHRLGQDAPADINRLYAATLNLSKLLVPLPANLQGIGHAIEMVVPPTLEWFTVIDGLPPGFEHVGRIAVPTFKEVEVHVRTTAEALNDVARGLQEIGRTIPGVAGSVTSGIGSMIGGTQSLIKTFADAGQGAAGMANMTVASIQWVIQNYQMMVSIAEQVIDTLTGAAFDAAVAQRGGMAAITAAATTAGKPSLASDVLNARNAKEFTLALQEFDAAVAENTARLQRYGLTWRDLGESVRKANIAAMAKQLIEDGRAFTLMGLNANQSVKAMSGGLNQIVIDAVATGQKIPAALQPMLTTLIKSGQLSDEAARAMLGMAPKVVVAFKDIEEAAKRYGIQIDQLGKGVQQIKINDLAAQIVKDWTLLQDAGADTNTVLVGMQQSVQDLVTEALKAGLKIPEGMRPIIQAMIDAGLLTDAFGNKLTDIGELEFEKPLTAAIYDLIAALQKLIDKLFDVVTAARGAGEATGQVAIPRGTTPPPETGTGTTTPPPPPATGNPGQTPPPIVPGEGSSIPRRRYALGGVIGRVLDFPAAAGADRIPILASEGEGILSAEAMRVIGRDGFERLNQAWRAGPASVAPSSDAAAGVSVVVTVAINNPIVRDETDLAAIKRGVEDAIVEVLHREQATNSRGVKTIVRRMVS